MKNQKNSKGSKIPSNAKSNPSKESNAKIKGDHLKDAKNPSNENAISKDIQSNIESRLKDIPRYAGSINTPSIYSIPKEKWDAMSDREKKKFRRGMRSKLKRFSNEILGKDRSDDQRRSAINEFMKFFKENYIAEKLDPSAIYSGSNEVQRKEYADMIYIIENFK